MLAFAVPFALLVAGQSRGCDPVLDFDCGAASAPAGDRAVAIAGEISDVRDGVVGGEAVVVVASTHKGARRLTLVDKAGRARPGPAVPDDAVSFDVCGGGIVFVDADGVKDATGKRVLSERPLLAVPDPTLLTAAELCPVPGVLVVATAAGLAVTTSTSTQLLALPARARAYAGRAPRTLRAERPYAQALSLYAPRLFAVDVDADNDLDLVAVHEGRLAFFRKDGAGFGAAEERDLAKLVGAGVDDDVRVRFFRSRAYVSVSRGAVPEKSRVVVLGGDAAAPLSRVAETINVDGLAVLLGVARSGSASASPVIARINTTLVALSGVVLTGKVAVNVVVAGRDALSLAAAADVRAGKIDGALPIVDVDIGGDGVVDVIDLGDADRVVPYRGVADRDGSIRFEAQPPRAVGHFGMALPLRGAAGLVLVGRSAVTVVRF